MFVISMVHAIFLLMVLCVGIILGAVAMMFMYRSRDARIWEAISARPAVGPPPSRDWVFAPEPVHAVVTTAPRPAPASVLGDETVINPKYTPTQLDDLEADLTDRGFPGTDPDHKFRVTDTMPGRVIRQGPVWDASYSVQPPRTDTVSPVDTQFMWPSGETTSELLDRLERDAYESSRMAICG